MRKNSWYRIVVLTVCLSVGMLSAGDGGKADRERKIYYTEEYGKKDLAEAVKWFRKAAEKGNAEAQYGLGICYEYGQGVEKDLAESVKWYRKAAEQGLADAQCAFGICIVRARDIARAHLEVFVQISEELRSDDIWAKLLREASQASDLKEKPDHCFAEAVKWWRKAAEQDNVMAQYFLGVAYVQGDGVEKNRAEAEKWLSKAAAQGHVKAQFYLGECYVAWNDYTEAMKCFRKAADQGYAEAQAKLGACYYVGCYGVTEYYSEAVKWYRKAAAQGFQPAIEMLKQIE